MKNSYKNYYDKFNNKELEVDKCSLLLGTLNGYELNFFFNEYFKEKSKDKWLINNSFEFALVLSKYRLSYKEYKKDLQDDYPFYIIFNSHPENIIIHESIYGFITIPLK